MEGWLEEVIEQAKFSTCQRSKCGSIIVKDNEIIGQGFNSPTANLESQRRCKNRKLSERFKSDRTCCVHAEQRAIMDALRRNPIKITGSVLYFIRLDSNNRPEVAGEPYCTICSKMALDTGVAGFALWQNDSWKIYDTEKYNTLSYNY